MSEEANVASLHRSAPWTAWHTGPWLEKTPLVTVRSGTRTRGFGRGESPSKSALVRRRGGEGETRSAPRSELGAMGESVGAGV